ncbi:Ig-like domain (group 2) [Acetitomaculum ruminis DSM 5522]|uniref:Ig-like domain (Group 2) n=1 Tax=Acetitomaculum ruminis DSM 5522 TaxID=1120918 RepID=A0A1I0YDN8_9FIRM|nr:Ig-like domain-containing protein [Acetitomaculum ruminis]SFB10478.1 Ig-like domain (group 2) [Acetitomaculum ruminis DSM 5522]
MKKKSINKFLIIVTALILCLTPTINTFADSSQTASYVILNCYKKVLNIKDEYTLITFTSNGKMPTFKSSDSSVASVNTYGTITAKKAGKCKITAKIKNAEASCYIQVVKTKIYLDSKKVSMENGSVYYLNGRTSNGSAITYSSSKKSIATVSDMGVIEAHKPGNAVIYAKADKTTVMCKVTVKKPKINLTYKNIEIYRNQEFTLPFTTSSNLTPEFKSNKTSIAIVNESGSVFGIKHGEADIIVSLDGVTRLCHVKVKSPEITMNRSCLTLKAGKRAILSATVSSGNEPLWKSSNPSVCIVNQKGQLTAIKKGKATITVSEDGSKCSCQVIVK